MNTALPFSRSGFWQRAVRALPAAALGIGLLAAAPAAQAQTVYGITPGGGALVTFTPATLLAGLPPTVTAISGVGAGQALVGIDSRPATGELFALGYNGAGTVQLYTLDKTSGAATAVGAPLALALGGPTERIGFDFNPTVDRIRVTSSNDTNFRLNPNNGALAATDLALKFPAPSADNPAVGAVAYTNSFLGTAGTTLYDIDESRSTLYIQSPPNDGVLTAGQPLVNNSNPLLTAGDQTDFDIYTDPASRAQTTLLAVTRAVSTGTAFYTLNLGTGDASLVTNGSAGLFVSDIAFGIERTAPAVSGELLYAVNTNNALLSFYSGTPNFINSAVGITGVTAGQTLVGTDFRPNTGQLFGLGYDAATAGANAQLYTLNLTTGAASVVGPAIRLELGGPTDNIGFDFNPTVDRIRVTSTNRANYRLNPNNPAVIITDGTLTYAAGDANQGAGPRIGAVAYTNSFAGTTGTTLFDIDEALSILTRQDPPNAGTLNTVGSNTGLALNPANALVDLDIYYDGGASVNRAFLTANPGGQAGSNLYTLDLGTAAPALVGAIGLGIPVRDVAAFIAPLAQPALVGQLLYALAGSNLVSFDSGNPGALRSAVNLSGLPATQALAGLDFSPATGELFALGYDAANQQGQLYTLNVTSGALTPVGSLAGLPLGTSASAIGFDFNPTVNLIRITSATNQANLRMNPATGTFVTDAPLTNPGGAPAMSAAAYINNDNNANTGTTLYGYDQARNVLLRSTNANAGTYVDQGPSGIAVGTTGVDFDVYSDISNAALPANSAFLVTAPSGSTTDNLYTVNLQTGATTLTGRIGNGSSISNLAAFLTPGPVIAAGLTWTGAVSTDWGTPGNWTPMQVPTATDNVTIPNVANDPVVSNAQLANGVTLLSGATLTTANGGTLTLNGSFVNNGGTTLGAGTGTVAFNGASPQTISGTTTFFNNLTAGPTGLVANAPVQVQRVLLVNGRINSNGNLTLLSNALGTAHVVNVDTASVRGSVTVQRYIEPSLNPGAGYRHYSAPVTGSTVGDLATAGFTPVVNPQYNTVGNTATPFPTVFGYDQARVNTSGNPAPQDFDKGFFSPNTLADPLTVTRGYAVNIPGSQTVDFVGTLNNGSYTAGGLGRGAQTESGWQLLGNPYAAPIDWDLVSRSNVDAAVYVYRSTGQYAGTYSSYVANGTGANGGTDVIGSGQGIFVRVSTPNTSTGEVSFANAARLTSYASPVFQRGASTAPLVRLDLRGATGSADEAVVYFDAAATAGFDASLDAYKLVGSNGPLLASEIGSPRTALSINALPALGTADVVVNLRVQATQAGPYTLNATELLRLPAGTTAYLRDAQTGARINLATQPSYSFQLTPGAATGRFTLLLTQQAVLATAPAALSQQVSVFPNPARGAVSISLPAALARQATEVQLVNTLGQSVLRTSLPAGSEARTLSLNGVARGIYTLRLQTAQGTVNKRLVVE